MTRTIKHTDAPPTSKQIWLIARELLEQLGADEWPETRGEASDLIRDLQNDSGYVASMATSEKRLRDFIAKQDAPADNVRQIRQEAS